MVDEVARHDEMVRYIARKTGLSPEKIRIVLYAGEPWEEAERFSALFYQAFQHAQQTGSDPRIALDAMASLMNLDRSEINPVTAGPASKELIGVRERIEQVARISKESPETVRTVIQGMVEYFCCLMDQQRRPGKEKDSL